ncbi:MAG: DUF4240 domain-containing protein [Saprospiraceae bacterium]|nr:DUF4240 domain-containing protein [Saprospiraceae bacterium]
MTSKFSLPLSEVDEKFLNELKAKYPGHTRLDIQLVDTDEIPSFSITDFWQIIDLLNWSAEETEETIAPAVDALSKHPLSHIYLFEDMLAELLYALDTQQHAQVAYPDKPISADGFLYVRAAIVAQGKRHYEEVLHTPEKLDKHADFEPLLSVAALAYEKTTKKPFDYIPAISYETYSNEAGWE